MRARHLVVCASVLLFVACAKHDDPVDARPPPATTPARLPARQISAAAQSKRPGAAPPRADAGNPRPNGIEYRGGPVMTTPIGVYLIWYGDWRDTTKSLVSDFVSHLGGSPYYAVNTTYWQNDGQHVANGVNLMGSIDDAWSLGKDVLWEDTEQAAIAIVSRAIAREELPGDQGGVFVVLVSGAQQTYDSPCSLWCAWHDRFALGISDIKIAMLWDPEQCPGSCTAFPQDAGPSLTPNGDLAADGIVSSLAHEIEETATDPHLDAWINPGFQENADMCSWTYGKVYATPSGAPANMRLGDRDWLVQQNWVNANGGACATKWP